MTDKKPVKKKVVKKTTKKKLGAPSKVDILLQPENFQKIIELTRRGMPRDVVALMMDVGYDTLLKAIKQFDQGQYRHFEHFAKCQEFIFRDMVKRRYYDRLQDKEATEKIIIDAMNRVEKKEESEIVVEDLDKPKVIIMPFIDMEKPEEIAKEVENQQEELMERIRQHRIENGLGE